MHIKMETNEQLKDKDLSYIVSLAPCSDSQHGEVGDNEAYNDWGITLTPSVIWL